MVTSNDSWKLYKHLEALDDLLLFLANRQVYRSMTWMPPQHGKSLLLSKNFPAWYLGEYPDDRFILASYESDYAAGWSQKARDLFDEWASKIWGLSLKPDSRTKKHWDILDHEGGCHAAGANAALTGQRGDIINIDDPHKDRKEAKSPTVQKAVEEWYLEVVDTRLSKKGLLNITQTRWDVRDLSGRILYDKDGNINEPHVYLDHELLEYLRNGGRIDRDTWVILRLPAIAEEKDLINRKVGEALCPQLHPIEILKAKKRRMLGRFDALYQGSPIPDEGEMFDPDDFKIIPKTHPLVNDIQKMARTWDLAGTKKKKGQNENQGPARTAGVKGCKTRSNDFVIHDVITLQNKPGAVRTFIKATALKDGYSVKLGVAHDPGQAAIDQMDIYKEEFKGTGIDFTPIKESGSKEERAESHQIHGQLYKIYLVEGDWNQDFIKEHQEFPNGRFKDRVDSTSTLYNLLFKPEEEPERRSGYGFLS